MKKKLISLALLLLFVPLLFFTSCGKSKVKQLEPLDYYFDSKVACEFFNPTSTRNLTINNLIGSKPDNNLLDSYKKITISSIENNSKTYHIYIDSITFYVYTNENSDYEFNLNLKISNVVDENLIGTNLNELEDENKNYSETHSCKIKKDTSTKFTFKVNKTITGSAGTSIDFDIGNTEVYQNDSNYTFKWLIYGLEIHAEPRAYNK